MNKNDKFISTCIGYNTDGLGIVKYNGIVFFVKNMLRDEEGEIVVTSMKKNYGFGKCVQLLKPSIHRVEPICTIYKNCGGCQLQHMDRDEQRYFKHEKVKDCFKSIAHSEPLVHDVLDMENPYRYRNKVQVPVQFEENQLKMGFYRNHTHEIIEFDDCLVQTEESNQIVKRLKELIVKYNCEKIFKHVLIKHAHKTNEVMVVFVVNKYPVNGIEELKRELMNEFENIQSIIVNINTRNDNVVLSNEEIALTSKTMIQEKLHDLKFNISSKSFYQINPDQTQVLYDKAIEYAQITNEDTVVDLYCGTGTIGIIASKYAKKVIGIEIVAEAIEDAKKNAFINDVSNVEFICADAKDGAMKLLERNETIDVVIVDPPRKGCDQITLESIAKMNPKRIIYVSCDPSTLARDSVTLKELGYQIQEVQPVDMFPLTHHVENISVYTR
ncbi:23S rRNA (uracil(1939)-C(5))-methyltransferase RlmD [Anaerorhabdus furcosa]|uniref:23S rRNA (Uracil1939-C5)-methyltransferase n=1 Tax=Anaerorhabdus furcosa TaxID=118967 RepID=A0A1T4JUI3_9FIRM|nr:23S rRNA (uracil(1939)-C(5))-methyltransferase RlmD [Anaerorhabdus furcosa]SJZ33793.1 23S rRNA (uracil1939-C5)-methyltransferase [Anaerorhabdus furcosa]